MISIDAKSMGSQSTPCITCPFAGSEPVQLHKERSDKLYKDILSFRGSHLCHSANNNLLCRGARDLQIKTAYIVGMIDEPTEQAFQNKLTMSE